MAESIFARVSRLLSATVEDAVDRMEQAGGDAVMREAIRGARHRSGEGRARIDNGAPAAGRPSAEDAHRAR